MTYVYICMTARKSNQQQTTTTFSMHALESYSSHFIVLSIKHSQRRLTFSHYNRYQFEVNEKLSLFNWPFFGLT